MHRDYIMRIVEQFVEALLAIMQRRKAGEVKEARELVRQAARSLLRIDVDLLLLFSPPLVLDLFRDFAGRLETEKCVLAADLLRELALIEEVEALRLKTLCLYLYAVGIPLEKQFQTAAYQAKVASLLEELRDVVLPPVIAQSIHDYILNFTLFKK